MKKVEIGWTYPRSLENVWNDEFVWDGWGLYAIHRIHGTNETLIYIGISYQSGFYERLASHDKNWLNTYKGQKTVRFGLVQYPKNISPERIKTVESALIYETQPAHNRQSKNTYTPEADLRIYSSGYRGFVPKEVLTINHSPL